jgi:hypothetical protein
MNQQCKVLILTVLAFSAANAFAQARPAHPSPVIKADRAAIRADVKQIHVDKKAGNVAAVTADKSKLTTDVAKLKSDKAAQHAAAGH